MPRGEHLLVGDWPSPAAAGSALLLNPRLPSPLRARVLAADFPDRPDHLWVATSGTGGVLKIVALSRQALETSARAVNAHLTSDERDVWINPLPVFHVGGLGIILRAGLSGARWENFAPWNPAAFAHAANRFRATLTSLVPTQISDLVRERIPAPPSLRAAIVGGGHLEENLHRQAVALGWPLCPSYGLTEAASQVATAYPVDGDDVAGVPLLPHWQARLGAAAVLELRGDALLTGWMIFHEEGGALWEDPKSDGWFRTPDRAELRDGRLRILGRVDDLVKIRGELVDLAALERALQARVPSGDVALRLEADARNGHRLHLIATNPAAAAEARAATHDVFPPFARPATCTVAEIPRTPLGKVIRKL